MALNDTLMYVQSLIVPFKQMACIRLLLELIEKNLVVDDIKCLAEVH